MTYLFVINTEGQVHTWKYIIKILSEHGHKVLIRARNYGTTLELLKAEGLTCSSFEPIRSKHFKILTVGEHAFYALKLLFSQDKPDGVMGFGVDAALIARITGKPSIVFTDSEPVGIQNKLLKSLASVVVTPANFNIDFGKKHIRVPSYKELAYLHPKYFQPDPGIFRELGLSADDRYIILRFNAFDAVHDIGRKGFSIEDKYRLVKTLEPYGHVFISSETPLPDDLKKYQLPIPAYRIHHALYYAQLLVSDTQTLSTEAAILGVPAIRCNNFVGPDDMSNFIELEQKYGLLYSFTQPSQAIDKAVELIKQPDIKNAWQEKRLKLLEDKIDLTGFMVEFIENWPGSFNRLKSAKNMK